MRNTVPAHDYRAGRAYRQSREIGTSGRRSVLPWPRVGGEGLRRRRTSVVAVGVVGDALCTIRSERHGARSGLTL